MSGVTDRLAPLFEPRGVIIAGASTHPGTGVPTALVSGRLAAARLVDEMVGPVRDRSRRAAPDDR